MNATTAKCTARKVMLSGTNDAISKTQEKIKERAEAGFVNCGVSIANELIPFVIERLRGDDFKISLKKSSVDKQTWVVIEWMDIK